MLFICFLLITYAQALSLERRPYYHSTSELLNSLRKTASTCDHAILRFATVRNSTHIATTIPPIPVLIISHRAKHLPASTLNTRPTILATFAEHGRELITAELALHIVKSLCSFPPQFISHIRLILLPLANPYGHLLAETTTPCSRANENGVDLNRNYPPFWGIHDSNSLRDEESPGRAPLSEIGSRVVDALAVLYRPVVYVTFHSGDTSILPPFDHGRTFPIGETSARLWHGARKIRKHHCPSCNIGTAQELFGYNAYGTCVDHMFGLMRIPYVYTFEIYGDEDAGEDECHRMFNPQSADRFDEVMTDWGGVFKTLANLVLDSPNIYSDQSVSHAWVRALAKAEQKRRGYTVLLNKKSNWEEIPSYTLRQVRWRFGLILAVLAIFGLACRHAIKVKNAVHPLQFRVAVIRLEDKSS